MKGSSRRAASVLLMLILTLATGCSHFGHYPVNAPPCNSCCGVSEHNNR